MLFSSEANATSGDIIERAPQTIPLCPSIAAGPENNQVSIKGGSQARCRLLMQSQLLGAKLGRIVKPGRKLPWS
jgi:hypothetical protein